MITGASCFKDQSSSIKYHFIAIIFQHNFVWRAWSLAFKEELPIDNIRGVVFGSTIGVAGKDLFSEGGMYLLIESIMVIKWSSSAGGVLDCQGVDWGVFDVILLASTGLQTLSIRPLFCISFRVSIIESCQCYVPQYYIGDLKYLVSPFFY